jgi:hypothetical protein
MHYKVCVLVFNKLLKTIRTFKRTNFNFYIQIVIFKWNKQKYGFKNENSSNHCLKDQVLQKKDLIIDNRWEL